MSELEMGGAPDLIPGAATIEDAPGPSSSALPVLMVDAYDLSYITDTTAFSVNDAPALQWALTLASGAPVSAPSAATLIVRRPDGGIDGIDTPIPVYLSSATPVTPMILSAFYPFGLPGIYTIELQVTTADDPTHPQTRSAITECQVT